MKTYFKSSELPHIWAHLTDEEIKSGRFGKCPSSETFRGADYFSYWAVIGRLVRGKNGVRGAIVSHKSYSVTTSSHQSGVRSAVSHLKPFEVTTWANVSPREVADNLREQALALIEKASKARSRAAGYLSSAEHHVAEYNRALAFFGIKRQPWKPDLTQLQADAREKSRRKAEAEERARERRKLLVGRFAPRALELFRAGHQRDEIGLKFGEEYRAAGLESLSVRDILGSQREDDFEGTNLLRLNEDKTRVETSGGAQVLVRSVAFLWPLVCQARQTGNPVSRDLIARLPKLDNYSVNEIDGRGNLVAGCHRIPFSEIHYIARELNLPPIGEAARQAELATVSTNE